MPQKVVSGQIKHCLCTEISMQNIKQKPIELELDCPNKKDGKVYWQKSHG